MPDRTNRIGRHLPTSGGLKKTLATIETLGCETVQIFVSNPQGWADPTPRADAEDFVRGTAEAGIWPVVIHAKYLINLASPDPDHRERSARTLARELVAAGEIGAHLVVVHSGSHGGEGEGVGMDRLVEGLDLACELAAGYAGASGRVAEPVVENSVGAGTQLCSTFDTLAEVTRRAGARACVDTCHAHAAGYDLSTSESAKEVGEALRGKMGDSVALIHLNDAKNRMGSHRDGHRRIGEGEIPPESWTGLFAALAGIPVVMETPDGTPDVNLDQMLLVKELAGGLLLAPNGV
jgi:deoxyribonuclease-4